MDEKIKSIWEKVRAGAAVTGEYATGIARDVGIKATNVYNSSKLNLKILSLNSDIEILYKEIGKMIYAVHANEETSQDELNAMLELIDEKNSQIKELSEEIENLKLKKKCPSCGKVNSPSSDYCSACGSMLDE